MTRQQLGHIRPIRTRLFRRLPQLHHRPPVNHNSNRNHHRRLRHSLLPPTVVSQSCVNTAFGFECPANCVFAWSKVCSPFFANAPRTSHNCDCKHSWWHSKCRYFFVISLQLFFKYFVQVIAKICAHGATQPLPISIAFEGYLKQILILGMYLRGLIRQSQFKTHLIQR
jgi:hypothetical protein